MGHVPVVAPERQVSTIETMAIDPIINLIERAARDPSIDLEKMDRLLAMRERHEANQARKAFDAAIADAKAEIPPIVKNREVDFTSTKGRTHYRHEDLAGIAKTVDPILGRHGLSYRFRSTVDQRIVTVACILSHRDGHSEENTLSAACDESGNKNHIQAIGSAVTYLQRYTLKAALGLAASNDDDDRGGGDPEPAELSEEQLATLRKLITDTGADEKLFKQFMKVERLEDISQRDLPRGLNALHAKLKKKG